MVKRKRPHKYARVGAACAVCGFDFLVELHHVLPLNHGGGNEDANLVWLCPNCHAIIHKIKLVGGRDYFSDRQIKTRRGIRDAITKGLSSLYSAEQIELLYEIAEETWKRT